MKQRDLAFRYGTSIAAFTVYMMFICLHQTDHAAYETTLKFTDFMANAAPYSDLNSILQAGACWRDGVNVYAPSGCMGGGVFNYSPFLLRAAYFGIGPTELVPIALGLGVFFIAALALLPAPSSRAELILRSLAACSGTAIYALESSNFDVAIFLLIVAGILLILRDGLIGLAGYMVFLFAAALKFYPVALLTMAVREKRGRLVLIGLVTILSGFVFLLNFASGTAAAISILPGGLPFRGVFGAINIPFGLLLLRYLPVLTVEPDVPQYFTALNHSWAAATISLATRALSILALIAAIVTARRYQSVLELLDPRRYLFLMAGAFVVVFCFFATQNLE